MRRALREAVRRDGEVVRLPVLQRRLAQRRVLLLIDVSGSMKDRTDTQLRFAHTLARATNRLEVFTLGTRLTRITRAMRRSSRDQALAMASTLVADWDGGTRLGDALQAFLAVPRFAGFARGAFCIVLSDGLERGDPSAMTDAVARMSRLAWAIALADAACGRRRICGRDIGAQGGAALSRPPGRRIESGAPLQGNSAFRTQGELKKISAKRAYRSRTGKWEG